MDWSAPHLGYVAAAYAASAVVLLALALWLMARDRRNAQALRDHEARRGRER